MRRILADRALATYAWWLTQHRRHLVRALKANTVRRDRVEERRPR